MSRENAYAIYKKCKSDPAFAARFQKAGMKGFEALAKEVGLPCSLEDLKKMLEAEIAAGRISPDELKDIVGGTCSGMTCY
jgi:hypothetical protein